MGVCHSGPTAEEKAAEEEQRRKDAMPPISVTVRLKDAEDITITVKPWQRVFDSVLKGLDSNQLWKDLVMRIQDSHRQYLELFLLFSFLDHIPMLSLDSQENLETRLLINLHQLALVDE